MASDRPLVADNDGGLGPKDRHMVVAFFVVTIFRSSKQA